MGLKEVLEKMKIVEVEEAAATPSGAPRPGPASPPPPPRGAAPTGGRPAPSMGDVLKNVPAPPKIDEKALPKGDDVPDFAAIFKAAGVPEPAHGYTAYKVLEFLSSPDLEALDAKAKAGALLGFLKMNPAGPVPITDVIQDAALRDRALDGFEEFLKKKMDARRAELEKDTAALQAEIDELTKRNKEKMDRNRQQVEAEKERLAKWQARKRIEERKLFDAVAPFVQENPVTLAGDAARPENPGPEAVRKG